MSSKKETLKEEEFKKEKKKIKLCNYCASANNCMWCGAANVDDLQCRNCGRITECQKNCDDEIYKLAIAIEKKYSKVVENEN